jgi:hypothetical protein
MLALSASGAGRASCRRTMPSRSASSAMVANSPDSSICFQRKARASALMSVLSPLLRVATGQVHLLAPPTPHYAERDMERRGVGNLRNAGHAAFPIPPDSISRASPPSPSSRSRTLNPSVLMSRGGRVCAARSGPTPPLPWMNFAPPFAGGNSQSSADTSNRPSRSRWQGHS